MLKTYTIEQLLQPDPDYRALRQRIDILTRRPLLTEADNAELESSIDLLCKGEAPYFNDPSLKWRAYEDFRFLIEKTGKSADSDAQVISLFFALRLREAYYRNGQPDKAREYHKAAYQLAFDYFMKESEEGSYPEIDMLKKRIGKIRIKYPKFSYLVNDTGNGNDIELLEGENGPLLDAQSKNIPSVPISRQ